MGTGDGLFVYKSARRNPQTFFIGIDANRRPLQKISERIHRKPASGGLLNVLFVQAAVEELPSELNGIASEVQVNFPWGSLLGTVVGDTTSLGNLRRICSSGALLKVVVGLDLKRDRTEIERLQLQPPSVDYLNSTLPEQYREAGFEIVETKILRLSDWADLQSSWARRLRSSVGRSVIYVVGRAIAIS